MAGLGAGLRTLSTPAAALSTREILVFSAVIATAGLLRAGYTYGANAHLEQLPLVLRLLDPAYLQNDFYVTAAAQAANGPRHYYCLLLAGLARLAPLPAVVLALTWLSNIFVVAVSMRAALRLLGTGAAGAVLAGLLAGLVEGFDLGGACFLQRNVLNPQLLALPLALLVLDSGLRRRPLRAAGLAVPCLLIHPSLGVGVALIALSANVLIAAWACVQPGARGGRGPATAVRQAAVALAVVGAVAWLAWGGSTRPMLNTTEFVETYAYLRNPHHCVPSAFPAAEYARTAIFVLLTLLAFGLWRGQRVGDRRAARRIPVTIALVLGGCAAGYVFVELWPTRAAAVAQPFRFLFVVKWLGFLLIAAVGEMFVITPLLERWRLRNGLSPWATRLTGAALAVFLALFAVHHFRPLPLLWRIFHPLRINYDLADMPGPVARVARLAAECTPPDAVLLTPPGFGAMRLVGGRAIVVDYREYPFDDAGLAAWRARLEACYGPLGAATLSKTGGIHAAMAANYAGLTDAERAALGAQYGADYAVLLCNAATEFPCVAHTTEFQIVALR
ncbi:MAG: DUF6798 domain-containing protein [Planctomycetota bacterium]